MLKANLKELLMRILRKNYYTIFLLKKYTYYFLILVKVLLVFYEIGF